MKLDTRRLLLCTNGSPDSLPALDYGIWLARILKAHIELLGIVENPTQRKKVARAVDAAGQELERSGLPYQMQVVSGRSEIVISSQAGDAGMLTVFGPLGRSVWVRWLRGRSFRRVLALTPAPLLFVREAHLRLEKILVCLGGLGYAADVEELSLDLAGHFGAAVTLLHVVDAITYDYPVAQEVQDHRQSILETDTPQGRNLRAALETAEARVSETALRVRHGPVVHEIIAEIREGDYDLVALGSPYSAQGLRHYFLPNVTAAVAEAVSRPVLTVRHQVSG